ncbi:phage tail tape measure protein, partial [Paralysiella testudinis]
SPSRLFKRFGGFMMEGLQIGLANGAPRPLAAIGGLASNLQQRFTTGAGELRSNLSARMQANSAEFAQARSQQAAAAVAGGGYTIHYSPTIHAPGGDPQQIQAAMQMGLREFEDMFNRLMDSRARRAY